MAEGFARRFAPEGVRVYSAGTAPAEVNPRAVAAMAEVGIDIRDQASKGIDAIPVDEIDAVVTLCGSATEQCPPVPGSVVRLHWPLEDPAQATGNEEEIRLAFARVRAEIERRVRALARSL